MRHVRLPLRLILAAAMLLATVLSPTAQDRPRLGPLIDQPGLARTALDAIRQRAGAATDTAEITISGDRMTAILRGARATDLDQWTWERRRNLLFSRDVVSGPHPVRGLPGMSGATGAFFDPAGLPLDDLPALVATAEDRAQMQDPVTSVTLTIRLANALLAAARPDLSIGMGLTTPRESAHVYFNASGRITRATLGQTIRARGLDMLRDDWHLPLATAELDATFGDWRALREVRIDRQGVRVTYDDPERAGFLAQLTWTLDGLANTTSPVQHPEMRFGAPGGAVFAFDDLDFAQLPAIRAVALAAPGRPELALHRITAHRPVTGTREPDLVWEVTLADPARRTGPLGGLPTDPWAVFLRPDGTLIGVRPPPSELSPKDWLAPLNTRAALDLIADSFAPGHKAAEITVVPQMVDARMQSLDDPARVQAFEIDHTGLRRHVSAPYRHDSAHPGWFAMDALAPFDADTIANLMDRARTDAAIDGGTVRRLIFSAGFRRASPPPGGAVLAIRVEGTARAMWLTYLPDGTEIDRVGN